MLRLTACFLITGFLFTVNSLFRPQSIGNLTRLTNTSEHAVNLNPTLSDDGKIVVFESSADLLSTGENSSFNAVRAELTAEGPAFMRVGNTRAVCPAISSDGKMIVFASTEDLAGNNADRNSEIFLFDGSRLKQVTKTEPGSNTSRLSDGNSEPSITADGVAIAFSSNRDFTGQNTDHSYEIFLYDSVDQRYTQLTNGTLDHSAGSPKISDDGSRVYYRRTSLAKPDAGDLVLVETASSKALVLAERRCRVDA